MTPLIIEVMKFQPPNNTIMTLNKWKLVNKNEIKKLNIINLVEFVNFQHQFCFTSHTVLNA